MDETDARVERMRKRQKELRCGMCPPHRAENAGPSARKRNKGQKPKSKNRRRQ